MYDSMLLYDSFFKFMYDRMVLYDSLMFSYEVI